MRIAILNYAADVGKSTLALHLLHPRIPDAELCAIDPYQPLNDAGVWDLMGKVVATANIIVDTPSWQTESLIQGLAECRGALEDYDFFLVPTTAGLVSTTRYTIFTIETLREIGVPASKIRLLFNCVERGADLRKEFSSLYRYWEKDKAFTLNANAVVHRNHLFQQLYRSDWTLAKLSEDQPDFLEEVVATDDVDDRRVLKWYITAHRMVPSVVAELDAVFQTIAA